MAKQRSFDETLNEAAEGGVATMDAPAQSTGPIAPFTIMADTPRNGDLVVQSIIGCKLRGAVDATKPVYSHARKQEMIGVEQAAFLGQFGRIPGQTLTVDPQKLTFLIQDPIEDDKDQLKRIQRSMTEANGFKCPEINGCEVVRGSLDIDRMKTLVREMFRFVEAKEAKVINGKLPTMEQIDKLDGRYLQNPGSRIYNFQPKYEDEMDAWARKVNQLT